MQNGKESFEGSRTVGYNVDAGFFAQHQAESLSTHHTVLESLEIASTDHSEGQLRTLLGAFLFTGDDVFKTVQVLSGGEKSRLALARTLIKGTNFLILDEPTNHLDIQSIQVLIEALRKYEGSFVAVSHDRHFLDQVANTIWHVKDGDVRVYKGTWAEYHWRITQDAETTSTSSKEAHAPSPRTPKKRQKKSGGPKSRAQKRREAEARNRAYRAKREESQTPAAQIAHMEEAIESLEEQRSALELKLGDTSLYENVDKASKVSAEYAAVQADLTALYRKWENLMEQV